MEKLFELLESYDKCVSVIVEYPGFKLQMMFSIDHVEFYQDGVELHTDNNDSIFISKLVNTVIAEENETFILKGLNNELIHILFVECD